MDVGAGNGFVGAYYNDYNVGAYYNESFAAGMERFVSYRHDVIMGMPSAVSGGGGGGGNHTGGGGGNGNNMNPQTNEECGIRDVWRHNLDEEFRTIRHIVQKYHYVAMDTEFPGVVARPVGEFRSSADYQYQFLRCNVDLLRIIQLGLTFMDEEGHTPPGFSTWQFNFKFNLNEDMYAQDSIDLLQNSGIQFKKHEEDGIDPLDFAELLMTSGIVLMDNIKWLSFHSGYDFGYLLKLLTDQNLPAEESDFFELLRIYFPTIYDVKYLMKSCKNLKGGLQEVADQLELRRVGPQHQAGSDSLLTGMAFFKMREMFFEDNIDNAKYCGHLYGLGTSFIVNGSSNTISSSTNNSSSATISNSNANANTGSGTTGTSGAGTGGNGGTTSSSNNSNNNNNNNNNNTNSSSGNNYHDNGETNATS
ncbi:AAEL009400-PA [Aedes aegypti]|uniref:poly(A)-specific ribonuclease n=4 Tax=Aedes aegypti TaxID=7159 RepID=A0A903UHB1_AEDAE|nr:CCR4-NOT transcription complex subunit 7 isoform X1 [Aedes aegypti]EAT38720.1 AAEL009400-PA [Aedes aegypti]